MGIYKRVLLKLSGESLMGEQNFGLDTNALLNYAKAIKNARSLGTEIAIVIGGGNIYRGMNEAKSGIERAQGDYMGMLATIINGMGLQAAIEKQGIETRLMSNIRMDEVAEPYIRRRAIRHLSKGRIVIFGGGTGNPYFTTDTAGVLKSLEIKADVILKGTRVDGIYDKDPQLYSDAQRYNKLRFDDVLERHLDVMDQTAFTLCKENKMPLIVFNMNIEDNLKRLLQGEKIGTLVMP